MSSKHRLEYMHNYDRYRILRKKCHFRRTHQHCLFTILWTGWDNISRREWGLLGHKIPGIDSETNFWRKRGLFFGNMKPLRYSDFLGIFQKFLFGWRMGGNECISLCDCVLSFSINFGPALHGKASAHLAVRVYWVNLNIVQYIDWAINESSIRILNILHEALEPYFRLGANKRVKNVFV